MSITIFIFTEIKYKRTGHDEWLNIEYDENKISFDDLLKVFWKSHDPLQ